MASVLIGGRKQSSEKFKSKFKLGLKILYMDPIGTLLRY